MRQENRWDAVINSVNWRIKRDAERPYRKFTARSLLELQELLNQEGSQFTSRRDMRPIFQTDWSAGAMWQKPLLSQQTIDSYYRSQGFDLVTEPGNIIPTPDVDETTTVADWETGVVQAVQLNIDEIYYPTDNGKGTGGVNTGLLKYNGSTFSKTTQTFGTSAPCSLLCYSKEHGAIFGYLSATRICYILDDDSAGGQCASVSGLGNQNYGKNLFMHSGRLMFYNADRLFEIEDPIGSAPSATVTQVFDDGMGPDFLIDAKVTSNAFFNSAVQRMAISSAEGVWIVKNVSSEGLVTPFIYRVDRTNDGIDIGTPVATLPAGTAAIDIAYHMGSLLILAATQLGRVFGNDHFTYGNPEIIMYHLTNNSLGTVGSAYGGQQPEDALVRFLGVDKAKIYIGGQENVWVYDAVRGGLHHHMNAAQSGDYSTFGTLFHTIDGSSNEIQQLNHFNVNRITRFPLKDEGGANDTHELESNYFDGNMPSEQKSVVSCTLMTSGIKTNETWTVQLETDDGSWETVATFTTVGGKTLKKEFTSAKMGYRFRYKLIYTCSSAVTNPSRVKGITFNMVQGEMVNAWQLTLDGREMRNVENTRQDPETALSNIEALAATQALTTYVDEFRASATSHDVRVQNVEVTRTDQNEIESIQVVLYEHNLDN